LLTCYGPERSIFGPISYFRVKHWGKFQGASINTTYLSHGRLAIVEISSAGYAPEVIFSQGRAYISSTKQDIPALESTLKHPKTITNEPVGCRL